MRVSSTSPFCVDDRPRENAGFLTRGERRRRIDDVDPVGQNDRTVDFHREIGERVPIERIAESRARHLVGNVDVRLVEADAVMHSCGDRRDGL